ncbi:hypothetical protein L1987_74401 [Smallanthus sonchifolius]|uniref:Uncharacterized protein n=1 Tax=Smallanthus sonchifolius TaxID=185202 RepID=A0ACB9A3U0_9ASTR|nr:hypothetical protein L1987_74401 [Smallanthus sonchifolius]
MFRQTTAAATPFNAQLTTQMAPVDPLLSPIETFKYIPICITLAAIETLTLIVHELYSDPLSIGNPAVNLSSPSLQCHLHLIVLRLKSSETHP